MASPRADADKLQRLKDALPRIEDALFRLGLHGLQRLSSGSLTELRALSQVAHNASLVTLERQIEVLATLADRYLERDPLFTSGAWAAALNDAWLRTRAIAARAEAAAELAELTPWIGEARRTYLPVEGPLIVEALTARGWVSDTGFVGVTVTFAVRGRAGEMVTASNARPTMHFGDDPRELLYVWASDTLAIAVGDLAHGAFELTGARRSHDGRLSLHRDLIARPLHGAGPALWGPLTVERFAELLDRLRTSEADPVRPAPPPLAVVRPQRWGTLRYDRVGATATAELEDAVGACLKLVVPLRPENNHLLDVLDALIGEHPVGPRPDALLVELRLGHGGLEAFPLTAIHHQPVEIEGRQRKPVHAVHLTLEAPRGSIRRPR